MLRHIGDTPVNLNPNIQMTACVLRLSYRGLLLLPRLRERGICWCPGQLTSALGAHRPVMPWQCAAPAFKEARQRRNVL